MCENSSSFSAQKLPKIKRTWSRSTSEIKIIFWFKKLYCLYDFEQLMSFSWNQSRKVGSTEPTQYGSTYNDLDGHFTCLKSNCRRNMLITIHVLDTRPSLTLIFFLHFSLLVFKSCQNTQARDMPDAISRHLSRLENYQLKLSVWTNRKIVKLTK